MSVIETPVVDDALWGTIASHSDAVDREARFPTEAVDATGAPGSLDPLVSELYLVAAASPGITVGGPFDGLGLCGNASSPVEFGGVRVGAERRLGGPASGMSLMMEATLPWFVLGCAACC